MAHRVGFDRLRLTLPRNFSLLSITTIRCRLPNPAKKLYVRCRANSGSSRITTRSGCERIGRPRGTIDTLGSGGPWGPPSAKSRANCSMRAGRSIKPGDAQLCQVPPRSTILLRPMPSPWERRFCRLGLPLACHSLLEFARDQDAHSQPPTLIGARCLPSCLQMMAAMSVLRVTSARAADLNDHGFETWVD